MPLNILQLFSKKRDAEAILSGYEFQYLKTLETWLRNRLANNEEVIYCEYDQDILERNFPKGTSRFRQIKLYASNFSFSSEAIKDTIVQFFLLFSKGEYSFDNTIFSFETNTSIASRSMRNNDADLLRSWALHQGGVEGKTLTRIRERVKSILKAYIDHEYAVKTKGDAIKPEVEQAKKLFDTLPDDVLDNFINRIEWSFADIEPDAAIEKQRKIIDSLIDQVPLPIEERSEVVFSLLYREIVLRSLNKDPEEKKLTNRLLDMVLLRAGNEKERWYAETFERWAAVTEIPHFQAGQFYQIIDAARYYRMNFSESGHRKLWMRLLEFYIESDDTAIHIKRKAIYEYLYLALNPNAVKAEEIGSLSGSEERIRFYFNEWNNNASPETIEDDMILLQVMEAQLMAGNIEIGDDEIRGWRGNIHAFLKDHLEKETSVDDRCKLLELSGNLSLHITPDNLSIDIDSAIGWYRQILPLLKETKLYSIFSVFDTLEQFIDVLIRFGNQQATIDRMEEFLEEIRVEATNSSQRHIVAQRWFKKGWDYLHISGDMGLLQTINCFHKAKDLWFLERTKEGYVLALLNLSQVYYAASMNIAGKYYALCALWGTWFFRDETIFNRLAHASGFLFVGDLKQGAWITALDEFELYMKARADFDPNGWTYDGGDLFNKIINDAAFIIVASKRFLPSMGVFFDYRMGALGPALSGLLQTPIAAFEKLLDEGRDLAKISRIHIAGEPLSDVGQVRTVIFNALGVNWQIDFPNNYELTAIGEEFVSFLQIFLCEVGRTKSDLLRKGASLVIHIKEGPFSDPPLKSSAADEWIVSVPLSKSKELEEIKKHCAFLSVVIKEILQSISTVPRLIFNDYWWKTLHEKEKIADKVFTMNTYQKVYRNAADEEIYKSSQRTAFEPLPPHTVYKTPPELLVV